MTASVLWVLELTGWSQFLRPLLSSRLFSIVSNFVGNNRAGYGRLPLCSGVN